MSTSMDRRRFLRNAAVMAAGIGVLGAAGCAADSPSAAKSTPKPSATVGSASLRMAWWGGDARHASTQQVLSLFTAKYPEVAVAPEFGGFQGYFEKLATQTSGGNAPDAFQILQEYVPDYGTRGQLLDLEPYVGGLLNLDDVDKASVDAGRIDGKLVAVSFGDNSPAIIVNSTLLEGYGLKAPGPDWTWDDLATLAGQVTSKSGGSVAGVTNLGGTSYLAEIWMRQRGKEMYNDKGELGFDKQDLVEWFEYWTELRKAGSTVAPEIQAKALGNFADEPLVKGQAAIWGNYPNQLTGLSPLMPGAKLALVPVPNAEDQERPGQYIKAVNWLGGYAKTGSPEATAALIDFFVNDVEAGKLLGTDRGVAPSKAVREAIAGGLTPIQTQVVDYLDVVAKNVTPLEVPIPKGGGEVYVNLRTLNDEISFEKITVKDGVDRFFTDAQRALG